MWPFSQYLYFYNLSIWPRHLHKTNRFLLQYNTQFKKTCCLYLRVFSYYSLPCTEHTGKYPAHRKTKQNSWFFCSLFTTVQGMTLETPKGKMSTWYGSPFPAQIITITFSAHPSSPTAHKMAEGYKLEQFGVYRHMKQEGVTLTRASTVCTGYQLFRPSTLLVHIRAPQAEVTVVIGNDCPIRSFLGCRNISRNKSHFRLRWTQSFPIGPFFPPVWQNLHLKKRMKFIICTYFSVTKLLNELYVLSDPLNYNINVGSERQTANRVFPCMQQSQALKYPKYH